MRREVKLLDVVALLDRSSDKNWVQVSVLEREAEN
jgi:hypothetical protein